MYTSSRSLFDNPIPVKPRIDIEAIVKSRLPPLPGSALRVLELLRDFNSSNRKLADAIGYDPSLTTRVLRLANSPIYALQKNVTSLVQAVEVIGTKSLYDIVIMSMAANAFASEIRSSAIGRMIWEHSLAVGLLTREFSRLLGMRGTEEFFICGLLHDIGKIMLLRADVETYSQVLDKQDENEMLNWELASFGYNHAQVGALVARRWLLPENICHAILNHHNSSQAVESVLIVHLIKTADTVANYNGYGLRLEEEAALSNCESAVLLRLDENQLHTAWEDIQTDLAEVTGSFN